MTHAEQVALFRAWLPVGGGASAVARRLGVTRAAVSSWATGRTVPTSLHRLALEALTSGGLLASGWDRPRKPHKPHKPHVRRAKVAVEAPAVIEEPVTEPVEDAFAS